MVKIFDLTGKAGKEIELPNVFSTPIRKDLIKRAFLTARANNRQKYGTDPIAGLRTAAHYHGVKDKRGSMKNREIARVPRTHGSSPQQEWRVRRVPQAVSGRAGHPPKAEKNWSQKINKKELRLAIKSAIAASADKELVAKKHSFEGEVPIVVEDGLQKVAKTKDLRKLLLTLNLEKELQRAAKKKIRPGKGKMRGRRYKKRKSVLFVVSDKQGIEKSVCNLPGCVICTANRMNILELAPGSHPGRLVIWTESAVKKIGELYG